MYPIRTQCLELLEVIETTLVFWISHSDTLVTSEKQVSCTQLSCKALKDVVSFSFSMKYNRCSNLKVEKIQQLS